MERRTFLKAAASLPLAGSLGSAGIARAAWENGSQWKAYEVTTRVELTGMKQGARVWLPLPLSVDTDYFRAGTRNWSGTASNMQLAHDPEQGTAMFVAEFGSGNGVVELTTSFETRDRAVNLATPGKVQPLSAYDRDYYTRATELLPTDGIVRQTALEATRGAKTDIEKAQALHEWIVTNCFRDAKVRGCGWGDIKSMLVSGNLGGKCGDLNALFVGMSRSIGIPARDVYGIRVAPSQWGYRSMSAADNVTRAQHCRAEFYTASHGWVPVDPADVRKVVLEEPPGNLSLTDAKVELARKKLFGAWEMNWMAMNYSHDVKLPGSKGAKLPYFMYPTAEVDGQRKDSLDPDSFKYTITSRKV